MSIFDAMRAQAERAALEEESAMRTVETFLFELGKEDSITLAGIFDQIAGAGENAARAAAYYEGLLRGKIKTKWNVCTVHGVNHEDDALAVMAQGSTQPRDTDVKMTGDEDAQAATAEFDPAHPERTVLGDMADILAEADDIQVTQSDRDERSVLVSMIESDLRLFRVGYVDEIDVDDLDYTASDLRLKMVVTCMDCGMQYPSLEDRMLKDPDQCSGCHIKASHG